MEQHLNINTCITLHEESLLFHFFVILASPVDLRPDGNHRLDAHLMQLVDHCFRIREIFFIKTIITASWPVIIVDDKDIQRNAAFFVLACHIQYLLLIVVAQFALPEAKAVLRHHRNFTNGICKVLFNFRRGITCGYPVVELLCGACQPFRCVRSEMNLTDRCIVPQEAVAKARYIKRNARLRIAVRQFQVASLQVHSLLLILSHTVDLLIRVGIEGYFQLISAALQCTVIVCAQAECSAVRDLGEQHLALLIQERNPKLLSPRLKLENRLDFTVFDRRFPFIHQLNFRFHRFRIKQCNASLFYLRKKCTSHPKTVLLPRLHPDRLPILPENQRISLFFKILHKTLPFQNPPFQTHAWALLFSFAFYLALY